MSATIKTLLAKIFPSRLLTIALFIALIVSFYGTASAAIWYVNGDIGTSGNGTTWSEAFLTIKEAVSTASEDDNIWVKGGTYSLSSQINVDKVVAIYGGFAGSETQRDQRDWATNVTKVDGQNSVYHCFYITADATLDGLTITGGNASGSSPDSLGGGIFNGYTSSPTITNCILLENTASEKGGGIFNDDESSPTITNCSFLGNSAKWGGGILNDDNSSPTIRDCKFTGNSADRSGSGIFNNDNSTPTITNCSFSGNNAKWGGGIFNDNCSPIITNCTFSGNSATNSGGGINNNQSSATIINCTLSNNSATNYGGGIRNESNSTPTITNCILWANTAPDGPEIYNDDTSNPTITYCDVQGGYEGEGNINSDPLFADPSKFNFHLEPTSPCIEKGSNNAAGLPDTDFEGDQRILDGDGDGTATVDMGADEYADTDRDELPDYWEMKYFGNLSQGSDGDYDGDGATNLEEYRAGTDPTKVIPHWHVDEYVASSGDGASWDRAFKTIQKAIDAASQGDEIWVKKGTYSLSSQINVDKAVGIYGGFAGSETQRDQRDWATNVTKVDGQGSVYHCFYVNAHASIDGLTITGGNANGSGSPDNSGGGIFNDNCSPTITNCAFSENSAGWGGGIINNNSSSPTITNCTFTGNSAVNIGGGVCNKFDSSPTIDNCTISENTASYGGGIYNYQSSPTISNCSFSENSGTGKYGTGGGIYNTNSSPTISNCTFSENSATGEYGSGGGIRNTNSSPNITNSTFTENSAENGGGIYNMNNSSPTISNCTFSENSATGKYGSGGGIRNYNSSPTITNCTFTGNNATGEYGEGGGIYNYNSSPTITNCILWGDTATDGPEIYNYVYESSSSPLVTYCDIQGGYEGQGNINRDPLFADSSKNDFHINATSPCIDKGSNSATSIPDTDFEGDQRIIDGDNNGTATVDMGADEYADTDRDELPDYWEMKYFGNLSYVSDGDYDGDGVSNLEEYQAGTNPTSIADGDVAPLGSRDGIVNVGDALVALRFALGLEPGHPTADELCHGDVAPLDAQNTPNPDGAINVGDALVILRKALGIIFF